MTSEGAPVSDTDTAADPIDELVAQLKAGDITHEQAAQGIQSLNPSPTPRALDAGDLQAIIAAALASEGATVAPLEHYRGTRSPVWPALVTTGDVTWLLRLSVYEPPDDGDA
jgi:hypothetical protein